MPDPLASITAGSLMRERPDRLFRDVRDKNGRLIVPANLVPRVLRATAKQGRPKLMVTGKAREAWEEALAAAFLSLAIDGTTKEPLPATVLRQLSRKLKEAQDALEAAKLNGPWLVDLPIRLQFARAELELIKPRGVGDRTNFRRRANLKRLLAIYRDGFQRRPAAGGDGPAIRFLAEVWTIALEEAATPKWQQELGSVESAVKAARRMLERGEVGGTPRPAS